jgi:hypothetical protein
MGYEYVGTLDGWVWSPRNQGSDSDSYQQECVIVHFELILVIPMIYSCDEEARL